MTNELDSDIAGVKYLILKGEIIMIFLCYDKLWRDSFGTIYALRDTNVADPVTRCGIGMFSLDEDHPLTAACAPHDFAYSSTAYQMFHSRAEADEYLSSLIKQANKGVYSFWIKPIHWICKIFGRFFWENKSNI